MPADYLSRIQADTEPGVIKHDHIPLGMPRKKLIWGAFGLLGASGDHWRPNQTDNGSIESCVWHVRAGGSVQRAQK